MCRTISGVGVYTGESVKIFTVPVTKESGQEEKNQCDSHMFIRTIYNIRDDDGIGQRQIPLELLACKGATLNSPKHWHLTFNGCEWPDWWTEDMTLIAEHELWRSFRSRFSDDGTECYGYLDLRGTGITSLGNLRTVGGYLDLEGCTGITSLGNLRTVGGYLDLEGCTGITEINIDVHGDIYR